MIQFFLTSLLRLALLSLAISLLYYVAKLNHIVIYHYWDYTSAMFLIAALFYLPVAFPLRLLWRAFTDALLPFEPSRIESYARSAHIWRRSGHYFLGFGSIGFFLGAVQAMGNLDDVAAFGASLALALLPLLYCVLVYVLIFLPSSLRLGTMSQSSNPVVHSSD